MATANEKYRQLLDMVRNSEGGNDTMKKLLKYSEPMTAKLNNREPVAYGEGLEPQTEQDESFYPYIFQNAWDKRAEENGTMHNRVRERLRNRSYSEDIPTNYVSRKER